MEDAFITAYSSAPPALVAVHVLLHMKTCSGTSTTATSLSSVWVHRHTALKIREKLSVRSFSLVSSKCCTIALHSMPTSSFSSSVVTAAMKSTRP